MYSKINISAIELVCVNLICYLFLFSDILILWHFFRIGHDNKTAFCVTFHSVSIFYFGCDILNLIFLFFLLQVFAILEAKYSASEAGTGTRASNSVTPTTQPQTLGLRLLPYMQVGSWTRNLHIKCLARPGFWCNYTLDYVITSPRHYMVSPERRLVRCTPSRSTGSLLFSLLLFVWREASCLSVKPLHGIPAIYLFCVFLFRRCWGHMIPGPWRVHNGPEQWKY